MSRQFYYPSEGNINGKVLVVPVVSAANVGQLAADLLISSLDLHRIGIFNPKDLVPVVGAREEYGEPGVTTPLELYGRQGANVVVIQQRSPVLKSRKDEFISDLYGFIQSSQFSAVIFLSGVDTSSRTDQQMFVPTCKLVPPGTPSWSSSPLAIFSQLPLPTYTYVSQPLSHLREGEIMEPVPFIPGGGLTRRILSSVPEKWSTPVLSLLQFVFEGDNRADAQLLASVVSKVFDALPTDKRGSEIDWKQPKSWDAGLFGTPHDQTLYG